uniref:helix-turn-helix domain-containing protein n=1 Tax=Streptomyces sp. F8 TaxID=1436085 RepID=UPI0003D934E8|nr:helix-turn-helix transcriptional regulator [Streptomyces sp. F8]AHE40009.1 Transcriptional regulator, XRE family [Streptomyces sp. F8]
MDEQQTHRAETIGVGLRALRRQRGVSLKNLAEQTGISKSYLSMVENGKRLLTSTVFIDSIAEALRISPVELTGQPVAPTDPSTGGAHAMIPALRLSLMGLSVPVPARGGRLPEDPLQLLTARVVRANALYHASEYGTLATELPALLSDLRAAADARHGYVRRRLLQLLAGAYHPACVLLLKYLGYPDLAYVAVTRAAEVIAELEDPHYTALSDFFTAHVLLAVGSPEQALAHAGTAISALERHLGGGRAPQALLGELHLISATAATRDKARAGEARRLDAETHLAEARRLAQYTGETREWHLNFGLTNVGIHHVSVNTALGRHGAAVDAGGALSPEAITAPGRRMAYHADLGRSLAHLRGREGEATRELLLAETVAPQRLRVDPLVRDCVTYLLGRPTPPHTRRDLRGLAHRIGVLM